MTVGINMCLGKDHWVSWADAAGGELFIDDKDGSGLCMAEESGQQTISFH